MTTPDQPAAPVQQVMHLIEHYANMRHQHGAPEYNDVSARARQAVIAALSHPAPGAGEQEAVAYLDIGAGGYLDIGSDLSDDDLLKLPKGRHMLGIIGTYGVDGYKAAVHPVEAQQAASENAPLSDFQEGQWWIAELDAMVKDAGTQDQKRAVAVEHHLLRASRAAPPAPAVEAVTDGEIDAAANDCFTAGNNLTRHQWRTFARAVLALARKGGAE